MQPTLPQTGPTDMEELPVEWLFKKERMYLLAQFWQQRATLAEQEVNTLKEQLSTNPDLKFKHTNGLTSPVKGLSDCDLKRDGADEFSKMDNGNKLANKSLNCKNNLSDTDSVAEKKTNDDNNNNKTTTRSSTEVNEEEGNETTNATQNHDLPANKNNPRQRSMSPSLENDVLDGEGEEARQGDSSLSPAALRMLRNNVAKSLSPLQITTSQASGLGVEAASSLLTTTAAGQKSSMDLLTKSIGVDQDLINNLKNNRNLLDNSHNFSEQLAAKNKEISILVEEISRLSSAILALQESHAIQIQKLEDCLESKRVHIARLEAKIDKLADLENGKKDKPTSHSNSSLKSADRERFSHEGTTDHTDAGSHSEELKSLHSDDGPNNSQLMANEMNTARTNRLDEEKSDNANENSRSSPSSSPNFHDSHQYNEGLNSSINNNNKHMRSTPTLDENNLHYPPSLASNNSSGVPDRTPSHPLLHGLPFQFPDRQFRFAEDLQLPPGSMVSRLGDSLIPKGDPMEAKLQEMLRYNMDKYANQNLDTLHISRRVRELLSVHNIGQRLFAKYVLGLSQGTVSELLSKPKPWDKLTEKGRDSYRKMHAWGCDDNAVMLLKSLIPKKVQQGGPDGYSGSDLPSPFPMEFRRKDSLPGYPGTASNDNVQQQQQQQQQFRSMLNEDSQSNDNLLSKSPSNNCTSPFSKDNSQSRRLKKYENDDIPQEKVARIYQEELSKIISSRESFPNGGMPPIQDENIRLTFEAYQRELLKLQQQQQNANEDGSAIPSSNLSSLSNILALQQHALNGAQDLSVPKEKMFKTNGQQSESEKDETESNRHSGSAFSLVRPKPEPGSTPTTTSSAPSPLSNTILPPAITPTDDFSSAASPLQRMASITNSLITQPPVTPHHSTPQRPLKAVLPPITQQQFDMFNNLNTEDIVRRVKEALSQYSISQRLFGESVLGLSQGSVSDLLARPKPWHMLTQKGREPFIRMKMFLEDDNAVHKLVASQYKIAPEKLMRTGNYSGAGQIPPSMMVSKAMPPMSKIITDQITKIQEQQQQALQQMQQQQQQQLSSPTNQQQQGPPQGMLLTPPGLPPHHAIPLAMAAQEKKQFPLPVNSPQQQSQTPSNAMRGLNQHMSPTVYEMAALTQDLDTQVITTKIKEALLANNIGQKIFGEAVLGLSQGSVSELLSKPKPWHMLSIKGREPFIRMQLWLTDTNNVDRLQALKNERREASKRRRSTGPGGQDNSSDTSSNDTSEFYHCNSPGPTSVGSGGAPPNKKQRVLFSEEQKEALRLAFALDPYPNVGTIEFLANELGLTTRTITNWFHNHRMRLKQQVPHGMPSESMPTRDNQSSQPFDPVHFRILLNQRLMELQKDRMGLNGMQLPYNPYFAANPNLAALISRGLLPGAAESDLAALSNAFKEQMSGLDLSLKREDDGDFDESDNEQDCQDMSDAESVDDSDAKSDSKLARSGAGGLALANLNRSSRRKPAAPQWVNPDWQDTTEKKGDGKPGSAEERIINGVCVMQQSSDFDQNEDEPVRIEPQEVSEQEKNKNKLEKPEGSISDKEEDLEDGKSSVQNDEKTLSLSPVKKEVDDESDRWDY